MRFIKVNNRILDYSNYRKEFALLEKIIHSDIESYLQTLGFTKNTFYNEQLDMEISVTIRKRSKPFFV